MQQKTTHTLDSGLTCTGLGLRALVLTEKGHLAQALRRAGVEVTHAPEMERGVLPDVVSMFEIIVVPSSTRLGSEVLDNAVMAKVIAKTGVEWGKDGEKGVVARGITAVKDFASPDGEEAEAKAANSLAEILVRAARSHTSGPNKKEL